MPKTISFLSVVFSFRNEEAVLPELVQRTRRVMKDEQAAGRAGSYELVFVNDASSDRSLDVLKDLDRGHGDIRVISMSRRFGVSPCVLAGMEHASGDAVVYMDADLQDPPELISEMVAAFVKEGGVDVVHTVRKSRKGESVTKILLTRLAYWILNRTASIPLPVEAGDFKLLSRRVVDHLTALKEKKPYMRGLVCWVGFQHAYVSYERQPRFAGNTKFPILNPAVINNFLESALISFSSAPLKVAIFTSFLAILADLALLVHVFLEKLQGRAIPGWTAIMIAIIFIGSIQLLCMGMMGLYINAIYEESRKRPNYIIESTYGFRQSHPSQPS
ncbi:MAG: glycosyltransferase family 2 protein [Candidatus Omnitrophota bacterium]|nr:glycosyltransferase family 2 protein [Candidatus Omnitrophota bacterium]MDZ4242931.1 glycosyltransferase family 2 protein [Candidatus Omnitrophota bacterium]